MEFHAVRPHGVTVPFPKFHCNNQRIASVIMKEKREMQANVRKDAICVLSVGRISIRCRWWASDLSEKLTNPQFSIYCVGNGCPRTGARIFQKESAPTSRKEHHCWKQGIDGNPKSHFQKCSQNRGLAEACDCQCTPGAQSPAREINGGPVLLAPKLRPCTDEGRE